MRDKTPDRTLAAVLLERLDAARTSDFERLRAQAELARAEYFAAVAARAARAVRKLARVAVARPIARALAGVRGYPGSDRTDAREALP